MMIFAAMLAGGVGKRMGLNKPKQFETIGDKPIIIHSIGKFLEVKEIDKIIVSSPKEFINTTKAVVNKYFPNNPKIVFITGGKTRNDTILNSIEYIRQNYNGDHILITHDTPRIFVTKNLIKKSIENVKNHDAASPVIPAIDVIFESKEPEKLTNIPLRKNLFHSQTPQSFKINKFMEIYEDLDEDEINKLDEAMILFFLRDGDIKLFEGDPNNFKITRPIDLIIAKTFLNEIKYSKINK